MGIRAVRGGVIGRMQARPLPWDPSGALYEASDLSDELEVRCQAHPLSLGSLLCVLMVALGQTVGVIPLEGSLRFRHEEMSAQDGRSLGVLMIDIDNFKNLNDTYAHPAEDDPLRSFGGMLRATLRESDPAARYGGERLVDMLRAVDDSVIVQVAEKLRAAMEGTAIELGPGREIRMTASTGVATTDQAGYDRMNLMRLADRALYRAKQSGRNQVELADPLLGGRAEPGGTDLATQIRGTLEDSSSACCPGVEVAYPPCDGVGDGPCGSSHGAKGVHHRDPGRDHLSPARARVGTRGDVGERVGDVPGLWDLPDPVLRVAEAG